MEEVGALFDGEATVEDIRAGAHVKDLGEDTIVGGDTKEKRAEERIEAV